MKKIKQIFIGDRHCSKLFEEENTDQMWGNHTEEQNCEESTGYSLWTLKKLIVLIRGRKGILEQMTEETEGSEACARRRGGRGQGVMGKHQVSQLQAAALWTRTLQV